MATSGSCSDPYSGRTTNDAILEVWRYAVSGNQTRWSWRLTARKHGVTSYALNNFPWSVTVEGNNWSGSHNLDFRSTSSIVLGSGTTGWITHDVNGYLLVNFSFSHGPADIFGTAAASGSFAANRIAQVPDVPPLAVFNSSTANSVTFTIAQPADNGGAAIDTYQMEVRDLSGAILLASWQSGASSQTSPPTLPPNTHTRVRYRAHNSVGWSAWTGYISAWTKVGKPGAPAAPAVSGVGPTTATVSWSAPSDVGGQAPTTYYVQRSTSADFTAGLSTFSQPVADGLSRVFSDLLPSTTYYFRVAAANGAGTGAYGAAASAATVSGAYHSTGTQWQSGGVFVSDGSSWGVAEVLVSDGVNWVSAI